MLGLTLDILRAAGVNVSGGGGGPTPPPYTPPLDDYSGAAAAYSVRLLSTSYGAGGGAALRVRRDVPPYDEQDIGFYSDGQLDNQAIIDFGGSDILKVSRWYDQSGQSNHAVQPTYGNQPQIYNGTEVITENGRPSLSFSTSSEMEVSGMTYSNPSARLDTYAVVLFNSLPSASTIYNGSVGFFDNQIRSVANQNNLRAMNSSVRTGPSISTNTQYSAYWRLGGTYTDDASLNLSSAINGGTLTGLTSGNVNPTVLQINQDNLISMQLQEMLVYNPPSDTNRSGIETNINDYYTISPNGDAATSGFLFDYPGATFAYSIRQLNDNADYCMQVIRADNTTLSIGFDGSGYVDTAAIVSFAGGQKVYLNRMYDQTGNRNHSGRVSNLIGSTTLVVVYDGTSLITKNGQLMPQIDLLGTASSSFITSPTATTLGFTHSLYAVVQRPSAPNALNMFNSTNTGVSALYQERAGNLTYGPSWTPYGIYTYPGFSNQPRLYSYIRKNGTDGECFNDGVSQGTTNLMNASIQVNISGYRFDKTTSGIQANCSGFQEMIAYTDDRTAVGDNANILANIKAYYPSIP